METAILHNHLIVGAMLFCLGAVGFLSRRNLILVFLSAEMMLQGVSISLIAWGRWHNNFDGQSLVVFIVAVAASEAAIALALAMSLFSWTGRLDTAAWTELRESNQPAFTDSPDDLAAVSQPEPPLDWPKLPTAGIAPKISPDETEYRPHV